MNYHLKTGSRQLFSLLVFSSFVSKAVLTPVAALFLNRPVSHVAMARSTHWNYPHLLPHYLPG